MLMIRSFVVIMKMVMIMRIRVIMSVVHGEALGCGVDAIDLHLDTLQLRRHRHDQGANVSAYVEHD